MFLVPDFFNSKKSQNLDFTEERVLKYSEGNSLKILFLYKHLQETNAMNNKKTAVAL